jgi:hypothetical protein
MYNLHVKRGEGEIEREMVLPNRMSLRPGLLWLTENLALIIQCLSLNNILLYFTYPVSWFRVPPGVQVPQAEDHSSKAP